MDHRPSPPPAPPHPTGHAPRRRRRAAAAGDGPALRRVDLALQGGGSHGAFTWGVLDRLLEDQSLALDGVSGTSAGALNAAVLACGLARGVRGGAADGGRAAARAALRALWMDVAGQACFGLSPAAGGGVAPVAGGAGFNPLDPFAWLKPWQGLAAYNLDRLPAWAWTQQWLRAFTPAQWNPLGLNRLRDIVERHVDPALLAAAPVQLFVTATSVQSGRPRVFDRRDISVDALLASACLPHLFAPVVIDGEAWWDGGYTGNPALWPLIYETAALDVVLVKLAPLRRERLPTSALEIADRVAEISFSSNLVAEMRAIEFVRRLLREGRVDPGQYKDLRLHMIGDEAGLTPLTPSSKLLTDRGFLLELFALGRRAADTFLAGDGQRIGIEGTLQIEDVFLGRGSGPPPPSLAAGLRADAGPAAAPKARARRAGTRAAPRGG